VDVCLRGDGHDTVIREDPRHGDTRTCGEAGEGDDRDVLSQLWLLDPVRSWQPRNAFTRFGATPQHFLADPALSARLLGLDEQRLLGAQGDRRQR
jgi:hypothetical protein